MNNDIEKIILTEDDINNICIKLGAQISKDYRNSVPIIVGLLKGCVPFTAELFKRITIPCELDFMAVSSYENANSTGNIQIKKDLDRDISNRDIILIDDVVDTGLTLKTITNMLKARGCKSIEVAALLDKPEGRTVSFTPKYIGAKAPNSFIVGFGLDYNELYRNLPYIGILKKEIYKRW